MLFFQANSNTNCKRERDCERDIDKELNVTYKPS